MAASHEDAILIVELAKWAAMLDLNEAARTIWADGFDAEAAEATDHGVLALLTYGETIGTLVKHGLLDRDLVYDWFGVAGVWSRVGPAATSARERSGVPQLYENFEALAVGQPGTAAATG